MSFKTKKYKIIRSAISEDFADYLYKYLLLKRQIARTLFEKRFISPFAEEYGHWGDSQVPNTYSHYADACMETLLIKMFPIVEKYSRLKLIPNYSYTRIYKNGDILKRHRDRFSCEISVTMFLGGQQWPIFINSTKEIKVNLKVGDMLLYRGNELDHWREPFEGKDCAQVFLHYTNAKTPGAKEKIFDARPHLGLPKDFKNNRL
tara:strand:- start:1389 stop:2000 length:612 start_codon:yes stop_codon:yes gene_type:complete